MSVESPDSKDLEVPQVQKTRGVCYEILLADGSPAVVPVSQVTIISGSRAFYRDGEGKGQDVRVQAITGL